MTVGVRTPRAEEETMRKRVVFVPIGLPYEAGAGGIIIV